MILQALMQYYEDMLDAGNITRPGWVKAKVSYALLLDDEGEIKQLLDMREEVQRGNKKPVLVPRIMDVPAPPKRSVNVAASFLCDNSGYMLGVNGKDKKARTAECFAASKALHTDLLKDCSSAAARAVVHFFEKWNPEQANVHPALKADWEEVIKGGNLIFWHGDAPVTQDKDAAGAWQSTYDDSKGEEALCIVTGRREPMARLHPSIKGVMGAQPTGASLVSFNAPAFCSYGHEQGANAPTSEYAAFAYSAALNYLIADEKHVHRVGDMTVVCWAEGGEEVYQDSMDNCMYGDAYSSKDIREAMEQLAQGHEITWDKRRIDPDKKFYVLGLAPNSSRLAVRFFWCNTFGKFMRNISRHYDRLNIVRPTYEKFSNLSIGQLVRETMNLNSEKAKPHPKLAGELYQAILNDGLYPGMLINGVTERIRAERDVTRGRAAIIKAYYTRNSHDERLKEVMTVQLNEQSRYMPYVLGRIFAILEAIQRAANPNINTTIKDRYFNSASYMPATTFPQLINLAQKHLSKLDTNLAIYYDKQLAELMGLISEALPLRMTISEQSAFQIGYYHEVQHIYTKKEDK